MPASSAAWMTSIARSSLRSVSVESRIQPRPTREDISNVGRGRLGGLFDGRFLFTPAPDQEVQTSDGSEHDQMKQNVEDRNVDVLFVDDPHRHHVGKLVEQ